MKNTRSSINLFFIFLFRESNGGCNA